MEEAFDLSEGITEFVRIGIDRKKINPKHEIRNSKQYRMTETSSSKHSPLTCFLSPRGRGEGEGRFENLVI